MIDFHAVAPELILGATVIVVLLVDLVLPNRAKWTLAGISAAGLLLAAIPLFTLAAAGGTRTTFAESYVVDNFSLVLKGLFIASAYVVLLLSMNAIEEGAYYRGEFYFLVLSAVLGMFMVASARDLLVLFIAFELFSAPGYLLAAWKKYDLRSTESGVKYFILGVLSTGIMLYGMSLLYGVTGSTKFADIAPALRVLQDGDVGYAVVLGIVLVIVGFAFKVSAVPFHSWAPDAYEGAPTPVTAFFSVSVKAAGFVGMVVLLFEALRFSGDVWRPMLWALAVLTMTVGNLVALRQTNIVRLLAYSSIAQSGYILAPLAIAGIPGRPGVTDQALQAVVLYLLVYAVMNLGAFGVVIAVSRRTKSGSLDSYDGLFSTAPVLAVMMTLFFGSLAGIPPLVGWLGKFQVFKALASAGGVSSWVLLGIAVVNSVIAGFYYMSVVRRMFFMDPKPEYQLEGAEQQPPAPLQLALGGLTIGVVVFGITSVLPYLSSVATLN